MAAFLVTTLNDSGDDATVTGNFAADNADGGGLSLREAILLANESPDEDTITFAAALAGMTLTLQSGELWLTEDVIINGDVDLDGSGITISGGDASRIFSVFGATTDVVLRGLSLIDGMSAGDGGAIHAEADTALTIVDTTLRDNESAQAGGAIYSAGTVTLVGSTVNANTAATGGGLAQSGGSVTLTNATVHGNSATGQGGGLHVTGTSADILNSTVTGNTAYSASANASGGGLHTDGASTVTVSNSVIAQNVSGISMTANDVSGTVDIGTYSFFGTTETITSATMMQNGGGDPLLSALGDHGGVVQTRLVLAGSPLADAGDASVRPADSLDLDGDLDTSEPLPLDGRRQERVTGLGLDIGASEQASVVIVDSLADVDDGDYSEGEVSLREALSLVATAGTIRFDAALSGQTITLAGGVIGLTRDVTIDGDTDGDERADVTISGGDLDAIFSVTGSDTDVDLFSLTLTDGAAGSAGGAIFQAAGTTLDIVHSTISGNSSTSAGGGIASEGALRLVNSTVEGNTASGRGGGIAQTNGTLTLINTTVDGNSSLGFGGGISLAATADASLHTSTIAGNRADTNGGDGGAGGGLRVAGTASVTVTNTVIAANTSGTAKTANDVSGTVDTARHSFFGTAVSITSELAGVTTDGGDPMLAALADTGGPVQTRAPLAGSPLLDAGLGSALPSDGFDLDDDASTADPLPVDARGVSRIVGAAPDIGAHERSDLLTVDLLTDEFDGDFSAGDLSLREALAIVTTGGSISFDAALAGGTVMLGGNLAVSRDVTVNGDTDGDGAADVTISGNDIHTIFNVTGAGTDVALHSLTLTGGYGYGGGAIALDAGAGLGIFNSTIRDSRSDFGGGAIESAGNLSIVGTTIHNNMADEDGGGLLLTGGSLTLVNSTLSGNTTGEDGGGIAIAGTADVRIESSTIADNTATGTGDEIHRAGGGSGLTITNSVVSGEVQGTVDTATGSFFGSATSITTSVGSINAGGDPMLDALGNNGGPVQTRAALAGSALIDAGSNAALPHDTHDLDGDANTVEPLPVDTRGVNRISGGTTDIGAVERIDSIVVDTLVDESDGNLEPGDVSLREALAVVGRDGSVSFAPGLSGTIALGGTDLAIRQGVTIDGDTDGDGRADIAISGNAQSRIFDISNVYGGFTDTVNLRNLSLINGIAGGLSPYTSEANSAGGAIYLEAGTLNILNTTISGNRGTEGGGISSGGIVTVTNSTISGNTADAYGGGLFQIGGSVTLVNSTVHGNDSAFFGGGLSLDGADGYFHSSTITGNLADRNGVGGNVGGGFELFGPSSATLTNTVVAGNTSGTGGAQADDVAGTVDSATNSFFGTYVAITSNTGSTVSSGDPLLSGLSDFGGPVQTRVPLLGSALIDGGDAGALPADTQDIDGDANAAEPLPLDANGNDRSGGAGPDIGAAEQLQTVTVNTLDDIDNGDFGPDDLSLREAVGLVATGGRIVFAAGLAGGTISLTGAQISLSRSVTIDGDTDGNGRADITIERTSGTLALFDVGGSGTGVELRSVTLTGGEASAVTLAAGAGLDIVNSTIRDNTTASVGGAISSAGDLTLTGSTLSGNMATGNGGAIYQSAGTLTLVNTTIDGNGSQAVGGGIATSGAATVSILNSTITGNGADSDGANASDGGGLFLSGLSDTTISNSVIALNTSGSGANGDDVYGTVDAATNSFFGTAATFTTGSDNINGGGAPLLAELADNGGPVETRLALAASPLVDAGNAALLPADAQDLDGDADTAEPLPLDANGAQRVDNGLLDIGATERRPLVTVDTAADEDDGDYSAGDLSLREALKLVSDGGTVGFDAALAGQTLVLGGTHLTVDRGVTIDGDADGDGTGDIAISGNDLSRILDVTGSGTSLDLRNLVLTNGSAQGTDAEDDGGAIRAAFGTTVSLLDTYVRDSVAVDGGGGISSSGALTLVNSTVSGNMAGTGGGITATVGGLSLVNSTVAGNSSAGFAGGIFIGAATATIESSTIASNKAAIGSALGNAGGGISSIGSSIYVINSVLAGNTSGAPGSETADDVDGGINSATNSFFGTAEAITTSTATTNGGGDPGLSALGYFGGDVPTLVPLAGSALIGAGNASLLPTDASDLDGDANTAEPLPLDATRGARVVGGTLDIGAAEERSATVVVDTLEGADDGDYGSGDISLREALVLVAPGGTISFDAALAGGTIDLGGSALALRRDVSISGDTDADGAADITVTGGNASRVFHQIGGSATLSALAITGGNALTGGQNGEGGGIYSTAGTSLVLSGVSITGSRATTGGGIANAGTLTLIGSTVSGNQATSGGGVHHSGQALIVNSTVAGNSTTSLGAGIFSAADLTLTSSTVSGNSAVAQGGGLYIAAGTATVANSLILGNATTAAGMGGPEIAVTGGAALAFGGSNLVGENSAAFDASGHANAQNAAAATVFAATAETLSDVDLDGTPEAATGVLGGVLADNGGAVETVALRASAGNGALETGDATLLDEAVAGQDLNGDGDMTDVISADGRGFARLFDIAGVGSGTLDLGAFELGPTPADDTLFIGPGGGSIDALAGNDIVTGSSVTDTLTGGPGGDALDGAGGNDTASYATATALVEYDRVVPTRRAGDAVGDVLTSIERIVGSAFNDDLRGAGLAETLEGGDGADRLVGRGGVDLLIGGAGNDILLGGGGGDVLVGGPGADFLRGDAGIDRANFADAAAGLTADLAAFGNNTGEATGDQFFTIENVDGTNFDDDLRGDSAGNHLRGRDGDDTLRGRGGDDTLEGGRGSDSLIGGNGIDRFLFTGPNQGTDTLTDFVSGEDLLVFTGASFGGLAAGALPAGNFALDAAADANDRFIYDTATGQLFFDADGTGPGAAKLLAVLAGQPLIGAGDILIT